MSSDERRLEAEVLLVARLATVAVEERVTGDVVLGDVPLDHLDLVVRSDALAGQPLEVATQVLDAPRALSAVGAGSDLGLNDEPVVLDTNVLDETELLTQTLVDDHLDGLQLALGRAGRTQLDDDSLAAGVDLDLATCFLRTHGSHILPFLQSKLLRTNGSFYNSENSYICQYNIYTQFAIC